MFLERLQVQGIRNIANADLELSSGANLFFGANGSGKTALLEAVHILSRGRSFRTRNLRSVISFDQRRATCFGLVNQGLPGAEGAIRVPIGVNRHDDGRFVFKVDGKQATTASQLAEALPVLLINPESFQLLEGSPGIRRSFLDWGVFHVEHFYRESWARFQKCLKHRNSLLRRGKIDRLQQSVWDREFCALAARIDHSRRQYLDKLFPVLMDTLEPLSLKGNFGFSYAPGWDPDETLECQLESSLLRDQKAGHTHVGPHRADLKITVDGRQASEVLSRGQTKTLVCGLKLAQGRVFRARTRQSCIVLLDDLPAELDTHRRRAVCGQLAEMEVQTLITGVERQDMEGLWPSSEIQPRLFHVEQGRFTKVDDLKIG